MKQHLNTLFVTTQGAYIAKQGQAIVVRIDKQPRLRVPIHQLESLVCFGRVSVSPPAMALCTEQGATITHLTEHGRFMARISGFTSGNVLLRREQYRIADCHERSLAIAQPIVIAKITNARSVIMRSIRDYPDSPHRNPLETACKHLQHSIDQVPRSDNLDHLRGLEGEAGKIYFNHFNHLINNPRPEFQFKQRSRRPPLDPVNAMLSFTYALLAHDLRTACESAGLDPAVGFLHTDRPGRPSLALDMMEEFRPFLADRLVLSLINRQQIKSEQFEYTESGAIKMDDKARKTLLAAWQKRKQQTIMHPYIGEKTTIGLLPLLQARLLARFIRKDIDGYPPFFWK